MAVENIPHITEDGDDERWAALAIILDRKPSLENSPQTETRGDIESVLGDETIPYFRRAKRQPRRRRIYDNAA